MAAYWQGGSVRVGILSEDLLVGIHSEELLTMHRRNQVGGALEGRYSHS